ncbi:MAG: YihY family inner membrane protein [Verrucomicrobia bacterium]|nr:YihY family inner membrane protein [Verrucomicrobiota bacterium]MDE3098437.1 YihY family inner membrane protein [Verrucomicrobiota bacterium]
MAKRLFSRLAKFPARLRAVTGKEWPEGEWTRLDRFAHFWVLVGKSFARNRCPVRAAALSYTTLLALIPLLAVTISVTSSLLKSEGEQKIYGMIDKFVSNVMPPAGLETNGAEVSLNLSQSLSVPLNRTNTQTIAVPFGPTPAPGQTPAAGNRRIETAQKEAAQYIHHFVQNTRSGALGVTGMVVLVFIAIRMLAGVEATFNDIWGVARGRSWLWRIVLYWAVITLGPLLLIAALGLAGGAHMEAARWLASQAPIAGGLLFDVLPLIVLWLAFALVYLLVPNTRVRPAAALIGGAVGGVLWHLNNVFGFLYVSRVVTNSKIYGSLGLVPVFMVGLYFSWLILLFGAQVAYAFQNRRVYAQEKLVENVNQRGREFIALRLMTCIAQRFQRGDPPATLQEISAELDIPTRLAQQVFQMLIAARLVTETARPETGCLPARPLESITAHHVLRAMRMGGGQELPRQDGSLRAEVYGEFARIEEAERQTASAVTLLALVNRLPPHPKPAIEDGRQNRG